MIKIKTDTTNTIAEESKEGDNEYTKTINVLAPPVVKPTAPGNLQATALSGSSIQISWSDNSNNEDEFRIYRLNSNGKSDNSNYAYIGKVSTNIKSYTDKAGLNPGTKYSYMVSACNSGGINYSTGTVSATTPSIPTAPEILSAIALSGNRILISWSDKSNNEDGFKVYRYDWGKSVWVKIGSLSSNLTSHTDSGLTSGTTYYYAVTAYNNAGETIIAAYKSAKAKN